MMKIKLQAHVRTAIVCLLMRVGGRRQLLPLETPSSLFETIRSETFKAD